MGHCGSDTLCGLARNAAFKASCTGTACALGSAPVKAQKGLTQMALKLTREIA